MLAWARAEGGKMAVTSRTARQGRMKRMAESLQAGGATPFPRLQRRFHYHRVQKVKQEFSGLARQSSDSRSLCCVWVERMGIGSAGRCACPDSLDLLA